MTNTGEWFRSRGHNRLVRYPALHRFVFIQCSKPIKASPSPCHSLIFFTVFHCQFISDHQMFLYPAPTPIAIIILLWQHQSALQSIRPHALHIWLTPSPPSSAFANWLFHSNLMLKLNSSWNDTSVSSIWYNCIKDSPFKLVTFDQSDEETKSISIFKTMMLDCVVHLKNYQKRVASSSTSAASLEFRINRVIAMICAYIFTASL